MDNQKPEYPTFFDQIKNLSNLAAKIPRDLYQGKKVMVSDEEYDRRLDVCYLCEHYEENDKRCKLCGCYVVAKAKFEVSSCPALKW